MTTRTVRSSTLFLLLVLQWPASATPARVVIIPLDSAPTIQATIVWMGDWADGVNYAVGEAVAYAGSSYLCLQAHVGALGNAPPDTSFWHLLAERGGPGPQGPSGVTTAGDGLIGSGPPGDLTLSVDYASLVTPSGVRIESTGNGVTVRAGNGNISISPDGSISIDTDADISVRSDGGSIDVVAGKRITMEAASSMEFKVGASSLALGPGTMTLDATQLAISTTQDVAFQTGGALGVAVAQGISLATQDSMTFTSGGSELAVGLTGISVDATQIDISSSASLVINSGQTTQINAGAIIDLNASLIQLN